MNRDTSQRRAIRTVLETAGRPLSLHEVLEAARNHEPGLGLATVYRSLNHLLETGLIEPVELPRETRYEIAGQGPHAHFRCRCCDRVYDLEPITTPITPLGFTLERQEVVLQGVCADCQTE